MSVVNVSGFAADEILSAKKVSATGFGTEYHDGSGFADCDPENKGNRLCSEYPKEKWCSECLYLHKE